MYSDERNKEHSASNRKQSAIGNQKSTIRKQSTLENKKSIIRKQSTIGNQQSTTRKQSTLGKRSQSRHSRISRLVSFMHALAMFKFYLTRYRTPLTDDSAFHKLHPDFSIKKSFSETVCEFGAY